MKRKKKLVMLLLFFLTITATENLVGSTYTVTNLNNSGVGSLRQAITDANNNPGADTIIFSIAGTINIASELPELSDASGGTIIDGTSAPGYIDFPLVILNGPGSTPYEGIVIASANNEVRSLQISNFDRAIEINGTAASGNIITGNYIGNNGTAAFSNNGGIEIINAANNCIGTDGDGVNDANERNVISGNNSTGITFTNNAKNNIVAGNFIGINANGTGILANGNNGVSVYSGCSNNRIGTNGDGVSDSLERNIISGNLAYGIANYYADSTVIAGNYIGVDVTGSVAISNGQNGITSDEESNFIRIGTDGNGIADESEGNVISGNSSNGVTVYGDSCIIAGNYIGTDVTGIMAIGNSAKGVNISVGVGIRVGTNGDGIADIAERNIISANGGIGIMIQGSSNTGTIVAGNYIGTDITGTVALGNNQTGIWIGYGATNVLVGTNSDSIADVAERNIISGNQDGGIRAFDGDIVIAGNYIGTDVTGTTAIGNTYGISMGGNVRVGTNNDGINDETERNVISGNISDLGIGVHISSSGTTVEGNYIGLDASGLFPLGNSHQGIRIDYSSDHNIFSNKIAFNGEEGIYILGSNSVQNLISQNSIFSNGKLGIDLSSNHPPDGVSLNDIGDGDTGPNNLQNFPVITAVSSDLGNIIIEGTFNSTPNTTFTLEFFSNAVADTSGYGEGENFLGSMIVTTDGSGDTSFTVTFSNVNLDDDFFTATATDPDGNTSEFSSFYKRESCSIVSVNNEWNMISAPLLADNMSLSNLFPTATSDAYGYQGGYIIEDTLEVGVGYWLKFGASEEIQICGLSPGDTIPVQQGWNMFGVYENDIPISQVITTPPGIVATYFFGFNNGYYIADTLKSGQGHWVRITEDGVLNLNGGTFAKEGEKQPIPKIDQYWGKIKITDSEGKSVILYAIEEEIDLTKYELPPLPPAGIFDARYSSGKMVEDLSSEKIIQISSDNYPITIKAEGINIKLRDGINGKLLNVQLTGGEEIRITNSKITSIEVTEKVTNRLPLSYELYQNYPNPFNPSTTIKFAVPEESKVNLSIYSVLGELVKTLVDEQMKAGYYEYDFNASTLASGVYFYRMNAVDPSASSGQIFVETKKLVLIK